MTEGLRLPNVSSHSIIPCSMLSFKLLRAGISHFLFLIATCQFSQTIRFSYIFVSFFRNVCVSAQEFLLFSEEGTKEGKTTVINSTLGLSA